MQYGGQNVNIPSAGHRETPGYLTRLKKVAGYPVASATLFPETVQAVFDCIFRVGANDGDGGALGNVQAYIGMTKAQFRLTMHALF